MRSSSARFACKERPLLILVLENRQNFQERCTRTKVDSSRRSAWTFTRLSTLGVCRYLENVDEVNCPRFLFVRNQCNK